MRAFAVLSLLVLLAACTTKPRDGSPRIQTTSDANRESLPGAVSAPLRDLNVLRTKIPDVLLLAVADPYARPPEPVTCARLIDLVTPLDDALGADLDVPSTDNDDLLVKGKGAAYGFVAGAASDVIPFRGWVRQLTGAQRHDRLVQAAITAGAVRRAYLKGLGEAHGCTPPATPSHVLTGSPVPTQNPKPAYPVR
jgi:hypothetical protein